jgi:hypothetical protein
MDEKVAAAYPDRQPAGTFTGAAEREIELPASQNANTKKVVLLLTCTGAGEYSITVVQAKPNTVGATCGDAGTSIAAVPLDAPGSPTSLKVTVPEGSEFWLSTYYTST